MSCDNMKQTIKNGKINLILELANKNDGYITTNMITKNKIHREYLNEMLKEGKIIKVIRSVYILNDRQPDMFYALTLKNPKIIFCEMTSLYLLGYIKKCPLKYDIVVDANYHDESLKKDYHVVKCNSNIINIGEIVYTSPSLKKVKIYDVERCICDLIKFKKRYDFKIIKEVINKYMRNEKNLDKLYDYASKLRVIKELKRIISLHVED